MIRAIGIIAFLFCSSALAQKPNVPQPPVAVSDACDQTMVVSCLTGDKAPSGPGFDCGYSYNFIPAVPPKDVLDNHNKNLKVLDVASKEQDRKGAYDIEIGEYRKCGAASEWTKISDGSVLIKDATLGGLTRIVDEAIKQGKAVNDRTKARAQKVSSTDRDHGKAKKPKQDKDTGQVIRE